MAFPMKFKEADSTSPEKEETSPQVYWNYI